MKKVFQLECADVQESWRGHYARLRGSTIVLRHVPTGLEVKGDIAVEQHTNRQLRMAEAALREQLMQQLTRAVAAHLRIPGL